MLTTRGHICAGLLTGLLMATAVTQAFPDTPMKTLQKTLQVDNSDIVVEEDGSGTQYEGDQEVRTFPADTFVWNCRTMGNKICGPTQH